MERIKEKITHSPDAPGVYIFKDRRGEVLYVGKAKSLKKRLNSYLGRDLASKTVALMLNVADVEYRVCPSESTALLLEANLIHEYKPRYNVSLRDDKSFPYVKITNEEFPCLCVTRKKETDGAAYFGPYTNVKLLRQALKAIRRSFPYRSCRTLPAEACIYYRLNLSPGPCIGRADKAEYARTIADIALILRGKTDTLVKKLSREMELKSQAQEFEAAAKLRDRINALSSLNQSATSASASDQVEDLKNLLKLKKLPERVEAFDISNLSGKQAVGSMVSFYKGLPDKHNYRRFRIKTVSGIDDYGMIREVVRRRYSRLAGEKLPFPDLVLIDGGKQHFQAAEAEIGKLGLSLPLVSIAKDQENIYIVDQAAPIKLKVDTPALNLIRRIRDEAHRFAVKYHRFLRAQAALK